MSIYIVERPPDGVPFVKMLSVVVPTLTVEPEIAAQLAPDVPVQKVMDS